MVAETQMCVYGGGGGGRGKGGRDGKGISSKLVMVGSNLLLTSWALDFFSSSIKPNRTFYLTT